MRFTNIIVKYILIQDMQGLKTSGEAEDFMLKHGEKLIDSLGEEVDRIKNLLKVNY
jgi:zinc transporter 9